MIRDRLLLAAVLCTGVSLVLWVYCVLKVLTYPWQPDADNEFLALMMMLLGGTLGILWAIVRKDNA